MHKTNGVSASLVRGFLLALFAFAWQGCATGPAPYVFGLDGTADSDSEASAKPILWVRSIANGLPEGSVLGFSREVPGGSPQPPEHWLRLKVAAHGMPGGAVVGFDGTENPDPEAYDLVDATGEASWYELKSVSEWVGVGHIPPGRVVAQTLVDEGDELDDEAYRYEANNFYEPRIRPFFWQHYSHGPINDCEIPPSPIYARFALRFDKKPKYWFIRQVDSVKLPKGFMFGSMTGDLDDLPECWRDNYKVEPYGDVTVERWLVKR